MSTQPTLAQDRVVDPIYTGIARGYSNDAAPVANVLFPIVTVPTAAGKIITFGPEDYILQNTQRAPGEKTRRVQFGHAGLPYALADHSLEAGVPIERKREAAAQPGLDLVQVSVRRTQRIMDIERENQAAAIARNAANYGASSKSAPTGPDKWDDPASDPFTQVQDARLAVRAKVGQMPNVMELPAAVLAKLSVHPAVLDRLGNAAIKIATLEQLQLLFGMTIIVGEQVYYNESTAAFVDIWGKDVVLAVVAPKSLQDMGSPSFGYTYRLDGYPFVEPGYYDNNSKTWYFPVTDAYQAVLAGVSSGFLIQAATN